MSLNSCTNLEISVPAQQCAPQLYIVHVHIQGIVSNITVYAYSLSHCPIPLGQYCMLRFSVNKLDLGSVIVIKVYMCTTNNNI